MEQQRFYATLSFFRTFLSDLAAAIAIGFALEGAKLDIITLTTRIILFILSAILYIRFEELLYAERQ
jgi:hypothetical protein